MKKHLIAAAVAAAVAVPAVAQVTVYGMFDAAYTDTKTTTAANVTTKTNDYVDSGRMAGSRLGFRGTEDLGGGLKAGFLFETNLTTDDGVIGANARLSFIELAGGFGTIRAGRQVTPQKVVLDNHYANGGPNFAPGLTNDQSVDANTLNLQGQRASQAITFISPSFSGVTVQAQVAGADSDSSAAAAQNLTSTKQTNFGVFYSGGPLSVSAAQNRVNAKTEGGNQSVIEFEAYGASYDLGIVSLHFTNSKRTTTLSGTAINAVGDEQTFGVKYPMGNTVLVAQIGSGDFNAAGAAAETSVDGYQLQAIYSLSKRTNVYAIYGDDESQASGATAKATRDGFAIGVRHSF